MLLATHGNIVHNADNKTFVPGRHGFRWRSCGESLRRRLAHMAIGSTNTRGGTLQLPCQLSHFVHNNPSGARDAPSMLLVSHLALNMFSIATTLLQRRYSKGLGSSPSAGLLESALWPTAGAETRYIMVHSCHSSEPQFSRSSPHHMPCTRGPSCSGPRCSSTASLTRIVTTSVLTCLGLRGTWVRR